MSTLEEKKEYIKTNWQARFKDIPWLETNTLFLSIHGSTSYGLDIETSDVDLTGICFPPREYLYGFMQNFEQAQFSKPDGAIYDLRKYFKLAADNNPNMLELLWIDPKFWVHTTPLFEAMVGHRDLFLSSKCKFSYSGYAISQLKRIKTHRRWLLNPPTHKPTREEFGLPPEKLMSNDQKGAYKALLEKQIEINLSENFLDRLQKEGAFERAEEEYENYNTWKKTRNEARAILEAKFGYDTKHAAHLVRLMRQCREILTDGILNVLRPDREELLSIRAGAWTYDQLIEWAEKEDEAMNALYETTKLPKSPDRKALDRLCIDTTTMALGGIGL